MTKQMTAKQLINDFLMNEYGTTNKKELADNWGVQIVSKGGNKFEIGTTYFYPSQNSTERKVEHLTEFAQSNGFKVTAQDNGCVEFDTKPWPKRSWATMIVSVEQNS